MTRWIGLLAFLLAAALGWAMLGSGPRTTLALVSGSENKPLEPIIRQWAADNRVDLDMTYMGSVDISRALEQGADGPFDAVWPANALWIALGDRHKLVRHDRSIMRSPVVLGLKRSIAERLGWTKRSDVTIAEIAAAAHEDRFRLAMTSATQSNSGASAYIGFLYALSGNPDLLTLDSLRDPSTLDKVRDLLAQVDRSSGSSGWLGASFADNPEAYDAMMNYEAVILDTNRKLVAAGSDPLYIIYPADGMAVADSPLGLVQKGNSAKEEAFLALQEHLLSAEVQTQLFDLGRRAGPLGLVDDTARGPLWNAAWGADPARAIAPVPTPEAAVIAEALRLYQSELRKPSLTVWVLDISGSMNGAPLAELKQAMALLLDPEAAALNLLQPSRRDITAVIPFSGRPLAPLLVEGNDPAALAGLLAQIERLEAGGGTDLYRALDVALGLLDERGADLETHLPAIIAMTDGASDTNRRARFLQHLRTSPLGRDVPIHSIAFGDADEAQLDELSAATIGRLFRAGDDLARILRSAKGYN